MAAPLLVALPHGLTTSGVVTWAVRLVNGLAARGRAAGLVVHPPRSGHAPIDTEIDARVRVFRAPDATDPACLDAYRVAARELGVGGGPVVISPNVTPESYEIAVRLGLEAGARIRVIGVAHLDHPFEHALLGHYEPALAAIIGVSSRLGAELRRRLPDAAVHEVPHGVPIDDSPRPARPPGAPLRLLYHGRIDHEHKRVMALVAMSDRLHERAVTHTLTLIGDGPAAPEIDEAIRARARAAGSPIERLPAAGGGRIREAPRRADVFVLASRREGMSLSMLEAMAAGCVPVVPGHVSGAADVIRDGVDGVLVPGAAEPDENDEAHGARFADAIAALTQADVARLGVAARERVGSAFSIDRCVERMARVVDLAASAPGPSWPAGRSLAFDGPGGSATVPHDAADRMAALLDSLQGRRVVIHGTGRHTRALEGVLARYRDRIVAIADDDPARRGSACLGWRVIHPSDAGEAGATDVAISSWINQDDIWRRRGLYERAGVVVHRLYDEGRAWTAA